MICLEIASSYLKDSREDGKTYSISYHISVLLPYRQELSKRNLNIYKRAFSGFGMNIQLPFQIINT